MVLAENENVVKVNENEGEGSKEGIHESLESLDSIFETKRHEMEFKQSEWSNYRRLWNVVFGHRNLIIPFF